MDLKGLTHYVNPFNRGDWDERFVSLDDTPASDFTEDDVAEVVAAGDSGDRWDGNVAAVLRLKDGRFVSYETFYGPTGDGFSRDAYGGDADLKFGATLEVVQRLGLTDEGRRLCGWDPEQFDGYPPSPMDTCTRCWGADGPDHQCTPIDGEVDGR